MTTRLCTAPQDKTLIYNPNRDKYLWFPPEQRPIVCQLGGSDPADLAAAAALVSPYGYDEINLNCGCPRYALRQRKHSIFPLCRQPLRWNDQRLWS